MKRRDFLAATTSLASLPLLSACNPKSQRCDSYPPELLGLVDVHCHLFNGSDIPSVRFIKIVTLHHYPRQAIRVLDIDDPDALDGLLAMLTWILGRTRTPNAAAEIKVLDRKHRAQAQSASAAANEQAVIDALGEFMLQDAQSVSDEVTPRAMRKVRVAVLKAAGVENFAVADGGIDKAQAGAAAELAFRSKVDLGVLLRWFALFTRYRYVLSEQLADEFRCQGFTPLLLCPATVDYDYWLGQYVDESPLPDQVTVMGRLARRRTGPVVHGYIGFDPLRQAAFGIGESKGFEPLPLVKRAIEQEGFLGVKLYPPMGFRASGNAAALCQTYPDIDVIRRLAASATSPSAPVTPACSGGQPIPGSTHVGALLDMALSSLFDYCSSAGAAVIAHANNSNGIGEHYGKRADPAFWLSVVQRWPQLHLCLAHFGGFEFTSNGASGELPESSWEWALGKHLANKPDSLLFADVSYLTEIAGMDSAQLAQYVGVFKRWLAAFDPECRHLVFGTDWVMLGIDSSYADYTRRVYGFFKDSVGLDGPRLQRLFSTNAARFLGLRDGDAARERLLGFYRRHGLPPQRLPQFATR